MDLAPLTPGEYPKPVTLEGLRVRVRLLDPARDGETLYREFAPEMARLCRYLPFEPAGDAAVFAAQLADWLSRPATMAFLFEDRATGRPSGTASYMRIAAEHRVAEVGFVVIAPWAQRSPLATEAHYLLARHVFEDLRYRRYEWKCHDGNDASKAAALRLGFRYEGTFRNHMIVKGENRDTAWFAMTDTDWPAVKSAFERWLAPENFDAEGRQRARLGDLKGV